MQNGNMEPEILCKMQTWSSQTPNTHTHTHTVLYIQQLTNMESKIIHKLQTWSPKHKIYRHGVQKST